MLIRFILAIVLYGLMLLTLHAMGKQPVLQIRAVHHDQRTEGNPDGRHLHAAVARGTAMLVLVMTPALCMFTNRTVKKNTEHMRSMFIQACLQKPKEWQRHFARAWAEMQLSRRDRIDVRLPGVNTL